MSAVVGFAKDVGEQLFYRGPVEIATKFYRKGLFETLATWGSDEGAEKIYKLAIWVLKFLGDRFKIAAREIKMTLDVAYGVMIFKSIGNSFVEVNDGGPRFKLPDASKAVSTVLLTLGAACRFVDFMVNGIKLVSTPVFGQISDRLGQYKVFQYHPMSFLISKPHDFCFLFASVASSIETEVMNWKKFREARQQYFAAIAQNQPASSVSWASIFLSPGNILKHVGNIGKIVLIWCGRACSNQPWYIVAAGVVAVAAVIKSVV